jgi:acetyltransferase-like isoleucine patch superfamily enzyme
VRTFDFLYSELNEWTAHILRWFPGNFGVTLRYYYYKNSLAGCGQKVTIQTGCYIRDCKNILFGNDVGLGFYSQIYAAGKGNERVIIGDNVCLNSNVMINADLEGRIEIGPNCIIGPNVVFRTSNHEFSSREIPIREQGHRPGTIVVKDNVWIGANAAIIGNVTIGRGSIIGAGAVVIGDVDDFAIVVGVPAKQIGIR